MFDRMLTPYAIVLLLGPLISLIRVFQPWTRRRRLSPNTVAIPLPLLARVRLWAGVLWVEAGLATIGLIFSWLSWTHVVGLGATCALLLAIPVHYYLSDEGIALGKTRSRRWTEFGGLSRRRGGARLQGIAGAPGMTVWLSGSRDDDEFVLRLRRLIKRAYQGRGEAPLSGREPGPALPKLN